MNVATRAPHPVGLQRVTKGYSVSCTKCGQPIENPHGGVVEQVTCRIYEDDKFCGFEHYHVDCYNELGQPQGVPVRSNITYQELRTAADVLDASRAATK